MNSFPPKIKVCFGLDGPSGRVIDLEELTNRLGISPSEVRTLDDWPKTIKNPKIKLPDNLKPRCCWTIILT